MENGTLHAIRKSIKSRSRRVSKPPCKDKHIASSVGCGRHGEIGSVVGRAWGTHP